VADLKRRTLQLSSGKQIKLFGSSVAISKSLEIGEGYAPNILSLIEEQPDGKGSGGLSNPHKLTVDELMDLADFNIQLWMDLKAGLRRYNGLDPKYSARKQQKILLLHRRARRPGANGRPRETMVPRSRNDLFFDKDSPVVVPLESRSLT